MDYKFKILEYRKKFNNKDMLKFVDFLELLIEWIETLYEKRRLRKEQEGELMSHFPKNIFEELDKVDGEIGIEEYEKLKDILLEETSELLINVIKTGLVRMVDFDSVQFNLYGIFGKEKIASMVEHARVGLEKIILKQRAKELEEREKREKAEIVWLKKINQMSDKDLVKLITRSLFEFSPSARTNEERLRAISKNQEAILIQKNKFHNFEQKIINATIDAKADAEISVNRQVGKVRRRIDDVSKDFRDKAKEFVSEEGPKKMINEAKERILEGKERLTIELKDKGKLWESEFGVKIEGAKKRIEEETINLSDKGKERRDFIGKRAKNELAKAGDMIKKETSDFQSNVDIAKLKFSGKAEEVLGKGKKELDKAREMILKEKSEFGEDVEEAKVIFDEKGKEIDSARADFKGKSESAAEMFIQRGDDIESEMFDTINEGKKKFEDDRTKAQESFRIRAIEMTEKAGKHITEKKEKFIMGRDSARGRFLEKSEGIIGGDNDFENIGKIGFNKGAKSAKGKIKKANITMLEKAKSNRLKMEQEMKQKRELFLYEVRFARDKMQKHAEQFAEKVTEKREEFETTQEKIVARHKAKQKAYMIHNLLRTIRGMH
jgi:hypothetical protein